MTDLVFVDSNVLIYAVDESNRKKHEVARLWRAELWNSGRGRISFQVLEEFYANVDRKWPAARKEVQAEIRNLMAWRPVAADAGMIEDAWKIQERYRISFWDSLIVSAAKAAWCRYLLTENLREGQELDGVAVVNPFRTGPREISQSLRS
jgi:predicted nucleic acid-binding protein